MFIPELIGGFLKECRQRAGKDILDVVCDTSVENVWGIENGTKWATREEFTEIAEYLKIHPYDIEKCIQILGSGHETTEEIDEETAQLESLHDHLTQTKNALVKIDNERTEKFQSIFFKHHGSSDREN